MLKLAAFLHIEVAEKDAILREKRRPVDLLMPKGAKLKPEAKKGAKPSQETPVPTAAAQLANGPSKATPVQHQLPETQENVPLKQVQQMMAAQEARFQTMPSQVFQHVMNVQGNQMLPPTSTEPPDEHLGPSQLTAEEDGPEEAHGDGWRSGTFGGGNRSTACRLLCRDVAAACGREEQPLPATT